MTGRTGSHHAKYLAPTHHAVTLIQPEVYTHFNVLLLIAPKQAVTVITHPQADVFVVTSCLGFVHTSFNF